MGILKVIVPALTILGLLLGGHYLVYRHAVEVLALSRHSSRIFLAAVLAVLALSFPIGALVARQWTNPLTSACYAGAATWLGFVVNLVLGLALTRLVSCISKSLSLSVDAQVLSWAATVIAVVLTSYGLWNAHQLRVQRLEVTIPGLPSVWDGKTIVHLSDLHLGHLNRKSFLERVVREVEHLDAELVVVTGDLFDSIGGEFPTFLPLLSRLRAKRGALVVTGNHETYRHVSEVRRLLEQTRLEWLDNRVLDMDGVAFIGVSFPGISRVDGDRLLSQLETQMPNSPRILLFHLPTSIAQPAGGFSDRHFRTYWLPDTTFALNRALGIHLQLSGHTHAGQLFPFNLLTRLVYRGFDYGLKQIGTFQIYTSSGLGTWGPPLRTTGSSEIVALRLNSTH